MTNEERQTALDVLGTLTDDICALIQPKGAIDTRDMRIRVRKKCLEIMNVSECVIKDVNWQRIEIAPLNAQTKQPSVHQKWKLVPIDPTEGMLEAISSCGIYEPWENLWKAALAAAPEYETSK